MTTKEIEEILNSYSWIKVKGFNHYDDRGVEENYENLLEHHKEETEFLIKKCRELAQVVKEYKTWED